MLHLENEHLDRWLISLRRDPQGRRRRRAHEHPPHRPRAVDDPRPRRAGRVDHLDATAPDAGRGAGRRRRSSPRLVIHADDHDSWCPTAGRRRRRVPGAGGRRRPGRHPVHLGHHRAAEGRGRPPPQHPPDPQRRAAVDGQLVDPLLAAVDLRRHQLRLQPHEDGHARPVPAPLRRRPLVRRRRAVATDDGLPRAGHGAAAARARAVRHRRPVEPDAAVDRLGPARPDVAPAGGRAPARTRWSRTTTR